MFLEIVSGRWWVSKLSNYLGNQLFGSFLSFFLPLFGIASLIFFIKLVSVTAVIQIGFLELMELYLFILPQILFFTLPIAFFAAGVAALHRLSFEYETIALFSLGIAPDKIVTFFRQFGGLLSLALLLLSLILIPQAKQLYKGFVVYKKVQAKINIKPSEFGHHFGDWYLFIEKKGPKGYENVALYNQKLQNQENFIIAKRAQIDNEQGLKLTLHSGHVYTYQPNRLKQIDFETLVLYDTSASHFFHYKDPFAYWVESLSNHRRAYDLTLFILFSLFPLASLYFLVALGIHNPRYEKGNIFLKALGVMALYFGISFGISKALGFWALAFAPVWLVLGVIYYNQKVAERY